MGAGLESQGLGGLVPALPPGQLEVVMMTEKELLFSMSSLYHAAGIRFVILYTLHHLIFTTPFPIHS